MTAGIWLRKARQSENGWAFGGRRDIHGETQEALWTFARDSTGLMRFTSLVEVKRGRKRPWIALLLVLEIADLAVRALLPGVKHVALFLLAADEVAVARNVALLVEGDAAGDRIERLSGMHHLGHLLGIERLRSFSRLL